MGFVAGFWAQTEAPVRVPVGDGKHESEVTLEVKTFLGQLPHILESSIGVKLDGLLEQIAALINGRSVQFGQRLNDGEN